MSKELTISVISPEEILFEGSADHVVLPGATGNFAVHSDHVNLVSELVPGLLAVVSGGETREYVIDGGFVEVKQNVVSALVEGTIGRDEIDSAQESVELDELLGKIIPPEERREIENKMNKHRARIQYAKK